MKTFRILMMAMVMTMVTSTVGASNNHNWKKQLPMQEPPKKEVCHECGRTMEKSHGHEMDMPRMEQPQMNVQLNGKMQIQQKNNSSQKSKKSKKNVKKQQSFGNGMRNSMFGGNR